MKIKLQDKIALNDALCQMYGEDLVLRVQETWYLKLDGVKSLLNRIENWNEEDLIKLTYADLFSESVVENISISFKEIYKNTLVFKAIEETESSKEGGHDEQFMFHQVIFEKLRIQIIEESIELLLNNGGHFDNYIHVHGSKNLKYHTKVLVIENAILESNLFLNELIRVLRKFEVIIGEPFSYDGNIHKRFEFSLDMLFRYNIEKY